MKKLTIAFTSITFLIIVLFLSGCFKANSTQLQANLQTLQESVPVLNISQHKILITKKDTSVARFELITDKELAYPNEFTANEELLFWTDSGVKKITLVARDRAGKELQRKEWAISSPQSLLTSEEMNSRASIKPAGFYVKIKLTSVWSFYSLAYVNLMNAGQKSVLLGILDNTTLYDSYLVTLGASDLWNLWPAYKSAKGNILPTQGGFFTGVTPILPGGIPVEDKQTGEFFFPHTGLPAGAIVASISLLSATQVQVSLTNPGATTFISSYFGVTVGGVAKPFSMPSGTGATHVLTLTSSLVHGNVVVVSGLTGVSGSASATYAKELILELSQNPIAVGGEQRVSDSIPLIWFVKDSGGVDTGSRATNGYKLLNSIYGKVTSGNPLLEYVLFFLQKNGETGLSPYPTKGNAFKLINGVYSFNFPDPTLSSEQRETITTFPYTGLWTMLAQASGDTSKKDTQTFEVRELVDQLDLEVYLTTVAGTEIPIPTGESVCQPTATGGATVVYHVTVDFTTVAKFIDSWIVVTEVSTKTSELSTSLIRFSTITAQASVIDFPIWFATECTKDATVTLWATLISYGTSGATTTFFSTITQATHTFILDLVAPTATILVTGNATDTKIATVTFFATDTKCIDLEELKFTFWFAKGNNSETSNLWGADYIDWLPSATIGNFATDSYELGDGDHAATMVGYYNSTKTTTETTVWATFVIDMKPFGMDYATLTAAASVNDCCDIGISHEVATSAATLVDNVFLSVNFLEDGYEYKEELITFGGAFKLFDGKYYLNTQAATSSNPGTVTVKFVDYSSALASSVTLSVASGTSIMFSATVTENSTRVLLSCTGYASKTVTLGTISAYATTAATETTVMATFTATDTFGNSQSIGVVFYVDTVGASLTYFNAFHNSQAGVPTSYIEFRFNNEPVSAGTLTLFNSTTPATWTYNLSQSTIVPNVVPLTRRLFTGLTLPLGSSYRLDAETKDGLENIGKSSLPATVTTSSGR